VWKVLRDTDGERFVVIKKDAVFKEIFETRKKENQHEAIFLAIKILLYVIIYPHATELFALRKDRCALQNKMNLC
jgi:hypothetical protein